MKKSNISSLAVLPFLVGIFMIYVLTLRFWASGFLKYGSSACQSMSYFIFIIFLHELIWFSCGLFGLKVALHPGFVPFSKQSLVFNFGRRGVSFVDLRTHPGCLTISKRIFGFGKELLNEKWLGSWWSDNELPCISKFLADLEYP